LPKEGDTVTAGTRSNIWTGEWYRRTIEAEKVRLRTPNVVLVPVSYFIDSTWLDKLGKNSATPIIGSLLNFTLEVLASDDSKKLLGFYPDISLTKAQKADPEVKVFLQKLWYYVTEKLVDGIAKVYEEGGKTFTDSEGLEWRIVPVIAFVVTDRGEAAWLKGLLEGWNMRMPCHICKVLFTECDKVTLPGQVAYRMADETTEDVKRWAADLRSATSHSHHASNAFVLYL